MIALSTCKDQRIAVFGLGRSGTATCRALQEGGADVAAWDDTSAAREASAAQGVPIVDLTSADWTAFDSLVLAPGVPLTHPKPHWTVERATAAGVEIIGDTELFCRERRAVMPGAPFIAITGTNGKSTTTALTAHVLRSAGLDAQVGGNIGIPLLALAPFAQDRAYVIEMSSYQIDLTPTLDPAIGVLLNITPDHIDRHGTFENYAAIKERLIAASQTALINVDDPAARAVAQRYGAHAQPRCIPVSILDNACRWGYMAHGPIIGFKSAEADYFRPLVKVENIASLRGDHNLSNAAFAVATADQLNIDSPKIQRGLETFPGLPHRMEQVGQRGKVVFINDSKATNADSADKALGAFQSDVFWIAGGLAKDGGIDSLRTHFPKVARAYLIGDAARAFADMIGDAADAAVFETLEQAVRAAAADAAQSSGAEPVVLLSPACASFDQFRSFEVRGDRFRQIVAGLPGIAMRERTAP